MQVGLHTTTDADALAVILLPLAHVRAMATSINRASTRVIETRIAIANANVSKNLDHDDLLVIPTDDWEAIKKATEFPPEE